MAAVPMGRFQSKSNIANDNMTEMNFFDFLVLGESVFD